MMITLTVPKVLVGCLVLSHCLNLMKFSEAFLPASSEEGLPTFNQTFVVFQINCEAKHLKENLYHSLGHHKVHRQARRLLRGLQTPLVDILTSQNTCHTCCI